MPAPNSTDSDRLLTRELTLLQLRSVAVLAGCDDGQLDLVATLSGERRYGIGDVVSRQGAVVRDVVVLLDGYVGAELDNSPLVVLGPGAVIGAPEALDGGLFPVSTIAQTPVIARVVDAADFTTLVERVPPFAIGLIRQLGGRARTVLDELACARQGSVTPTVGSRPSVVARLSSKAVLPPRH